MPAPASSGLRVLLAEDNLVNQTVGQLMLTRAGHRVDIVGNGLEAVEAVQTSNYDVVLMDIHMPVMDGLQATKVIRAFGSSIHQPNIVALTASVTAEDRRASLESGMDAYLSKPIRAENLTSTFNSLTIREGADPLVAEEFVPHQRSEPILDPEQFGYLQDLEDSDRVNLLTRWLTHTSGHLAAVRAEVEKGTLPRWPSWRIDCVGAARRWAPRRWPRSARRWRRSPKRARWFRRNYWLRSKSRSPW